MAKKEAKASSSPGTVLPSEYGTGKPNGAVLAEFCEGIQFISIQCVNPDFGSGGEDDHWFFTNIPLENLQAVVKSEFQGFTRKGDLSQMAQIMMKEPERALEFIAEYPRIVDTRKAKIVNIWVHLL